MRAFGSPDDVGETISNRIVRSLVAFAESAGAPRSDLLRRARIDDEALSAEHARSDTKSFFAVCTGAIELTGDPALVLHWQEHAAGGATFAPLSTLAICATTLDEALTLLDHYNVLLCDRRYHELVRGDDCVALRVVSRKCEAPTAQRLAAEIVMFGLFRMVSQFVPRARLRVSFAYPPPESAAEYVRLFAGRAQFCAPRTELTFEHTLLGARSLHGDEELRRALMQLADQRALRIAADVPYVARVRRLLLEASAAQRNMRAIACMLGLSARTLRRKLDGEGAAFHQLAAEAMPVIAKRYLRDHELSIQQIAAKMGFSDASTFHRAFRRWTGTTPNAFRAQPLSDSEHRTPHGH